MSRFEVSMSGGDKILFNPKFTLNVSTGKYIHMHPEYITDGNEVLEIIDSYVDKKYSLLVKDFFKMYQGEELFLPVNDNLLAVGMIEVHFSDEGVRYSVKLKGRHLFDGEDILNLLIGKSQALKV